MIGDYVLRVGYSYLGLLAGNVALLVLLLLNAFRASLWLHGQMKMLFLAALGYFIPIAIVSIVGWLAIGIPAVLIFSPQRVLQFPLWLLLAIGALLGPVALFVIFLLLSRGLAAAETFTNTGLLWACASLISTVAFAVHCALLYTRWTARGQIN